MLIQDLEGEFGDLLQAKNHNYVVEAASVLLGYLQNNGFKSSDEPDSESDPKASGGWG